MASSLRSRQFVCSHEGTRQDLAERIGISPKESGDSMSGPVQTPSDLASLGRPFDQYPTIRIASSPAIFKKNLLRSGLASVADDLAGDLSAAWERDVWKALTALSDIRCYASRCVLTEIDWFGKRGNFRVFILPRDMGIEEAIWANRTDLPPQERVVKAWLNASSQGRLGTSGPGMIADASKNQRGAGDNAVVHFDPEVWDPDNQFRDVANQIFPGRYGPYGATAAEALLHELVHAMRTVKGMTDRTLTGPPFNDTFEEFAAVLVTNIHIGESNPGGLRGGHTGFMPMQQNWNTSLGFLADKNNRELVKYLIHQDPCFCNNLAQTVYVNSFNPVRLLLRPLVTSAS